MKFNFKIQQYQTDAVESIVNVFNGQPYNAPVNYRRDIGKSKVVKSFSQLSFDDSSELEIADDLNDAGFKNEKIAIPDNVILSNIKKVQQENNLKVSDSLIKNLGCCSLDIEMETGERVIIVMGAVCVIKSRVSGTLNIYISCIA